MSWNHERSHTHDQTTLNITGGGAHPDLATHDALGLATDAELSAHTGASDPHVAYALDADLANHEADATNVHGIANSANLVLTNDARLSDARTPTSHSHPESQVTNLTTDLAAKASATHSHAEADVTSLVTDLAGKASTGHTHQAFPVGALYLSVTNTNPATSLGYGTWSQVAQGLLLIGQTGAQTGGQQVGNATHSHTFTQPSDHAALTHSGAAVANHVVTQPSAHSDHAAQAHSAHAGATVGNHTDVLNHVHVEQLQGGTTGTTTGTHLMGSAATGGSLRSAGQSTLNPTSGGVAAQVHTVGQASAHTDHPLLSHSAHSGTAVDAHAVTQPSNHAIGSHVGGSVATGTTDPPSFVAYVWQRTA